MAASRGSAVSLGQSAYLSGEGAGELRWSLRPKTLCNRKIVWFWDLTVEKGKYHPTHLSGSAPRIKTHCCGQALPQRTEQMGI